MYAEIQKENPIFLQIFTTEHAAAKPPSHYNLEALYLYIIRPCFPQLQGVLAGVYGILAQPMHHHPLL
jgi:hypothetical protein